MFSCIFFSEWMLPSSLPGHVIVMQKECFILCGCVYIYIYIEYGIGTPKTYRSEAILYTYKQTYLFV